MSDLTRDWTLQVPVTVLNVANPQSVGFFSSQQSGVSDFFIAAVQSVGFFSRSSSECRIVLSPNSGVSDLCGVRSCCVGFFPSQAAGVSDFVCASEKSVGFFEAGLQYYSSPFFRHSDILEAVFL